jgi:hypothetical protein
MLHLTLMGGAEVRLKEQDNIVITVMGGTEIVMPTLAEKIVYLRRMKKEHGTNLEHAIRRTNVITLMGATVTKIPTIGREIEELLNLRESGMMSNEELSQLWCEALEKDDLDVIENITVMGGAGDEMPDEKTEMLAIDRLVLRGVLSGTEAEEIKEAIDSGDFSGFKTPVLQDKIRNLLLPSPMYSLSSSQKNLVLKSHQTE